MKILDTSIPSTSARSKAKLSGLMYMGRDFKEDPFFKNLQIDFTSLSPVGKSLMENLINSRNLPLEKKGVGYTLQMAGFFNNRYKVSLVKAEEAAEDAVISALKASLETYATEQMMANGRRSWPTNPWDALETKPVGYLSMDGNASREGEWRFNTRTSNITHMRGDNNIWHWDYDKGIRSGYNSRVGSLGIRQEGSGD